MLTRRSFALSCAAAAVAQDRTRRITAMSYNIHHGEGMDGRIDLDRIAAIINGAHPHFVALQEVDRRTQRSGNVDQLSELAKLTGLTAYYGKTLDLQGGEYGNAILLRGKAREHCNVPLSGREARGMTAVNSEDGVLFVATHFDVSREHDMRVAAAGRINEWMESKKDAPAILAGDLNCVRGTPALDKLTGAWTIAGDEMPTIPSASPRRQIDFVLVRPAARWRVVEVRVLNEPVASDHRPVVAELELTT
jgi:endonuclease/exonuclease/phosphatase family metal-dependent hydrolase